MRVQNSLVWEEVELSNPTAILIDPTADPSSKQDESFFLTCYDNYSVLRIRNGVMSYFAGNRDESGFQDGTTEKARFKQMFGLSWSHTRNALVVCDTGGERIRLIRADSTLTSAGAVVTVAGTGFSEHSTGPALSAAMMHPRHAAWQPPLPSTTSTAAPTASAAVGGTDNTDSKSDSKSDGLSSLDAERRLFIACHWTIRRLDFTTGIMDVVPNEYGPISPSGLVFANPHTMIVSGFFPQRALYSVDADSGATKLIAGRTDRIKLNKTMPCADGLALETATFSTPTGMSISYSDRVVYLCDRDGGIVREFDIPSDIPVPTTDPNSVLVSGASSEVMTKPLMPAASSARVEAFTPITYTTPSG